jgi:SNF2 family DNA or RNA helicase
MNPKFTYVSELFSNDVITKDKYTIIKSFPVNRFALDIKRVYKTSKITKLLEAIGFKFFGNSTIRIHNFFLPELVYILGQLPGRNIYAIIVNNILEDSWLSTLNGNVRSRVKGSRINKSIVFTLKPYQQQFIKLYDTMKQKYFLNGYILSFEQGLGKTVTSLALMEGLSKDCVIIIAPKNTVSTVWRNEINAAFKDEQSTWIVGEPPPSRPVKYYIFNYESLSKFAQVASHISKAKRIGIIVDESHNFKNINSVRTTNLVKIKEFTNCNDVLFMSGTPIKALGIDMLPYLKVLDPFFDDEALAIFKKAFGLNTTIALDILNNRLGFMMHRKMKHEVLNLPKKNEIKIKVKISNSKDYTTEEVKKTIMAYVIERKAHYNKNYGKYLNDYNECLKYVSTQLNDDSDFVRYLYIVKRLKKSGYNARDKRQVENVVWANIYEKATIYKLLPSDLKKKFLKSKSVIKYVDLKIRGEVLGGLLNKLRSEMYAHMIPRSGIIDIINKSEKKTVIFSTYRGVVLQCESYLKKNRFNPILVYGDTSSRIKPLLAEFASDAKRNPLIATVQTMATGVTLIEANTLIFLNMPWRYTDYQQASDRIHRIGQDTPVYIYTLTLDTGGSANLSTRMDEIVQWSKDMFKGIVEG